MVAPSLYKGTLPRDLHGPRRPAIDRPSRSYQSGGMTHVLILGPQLRTPNLARSLAAVGMAGPIAAITAGWQEREGELAALEEHLAQPVQDLRLYARAETMFAADPELHAAYRGRQAALREAQDLYRLQLDHAKAAARELAHITPDTPALRRARAGAIAALRRLDARHLATIEAEYRRFETAWRPLARPALVKQRTEIEATAARAATVLVAGGHVAVLVNRLRLFGLGPLLHGKAIAAWSAGAMALTSRVLLFHDRPPQGAGNAELLDRGLALLKDAVFLPHAASRIALDDPVRTSILARRLAPAHAYTLDDGDWLVFRDGRLLAGSGSRRLTRTGPAVAADLAA